LKGSSARQQIERWRNNFQGPSMFPFGKQIFGGDM
jgi:hypothetical protein